METLKKTLKILSYPLAVLFGYLGGVLKTGQKYPSSRRLGLIKLIVGTLYLAYHSVDVVSYIGMVITLGLIWLIRELYSIIYG
jgi:hypothetical protein